MKNNIQALCVSMIAVVFSWLVPATYAVAKNCKPSAELIDSYMEFRKISSGLHNRPDLVSSDVIKAGSIEEIQYNSAGTPVEKYYETLNYHIRNRAVQVNQAAIAGYDESIAWAKLRIENSLCVNNRAPDPSLYQAGNVPQNNSNQDQPTAENNSNQASNDSPPTKKLTAAERKKQQAQQKAEEISTKSQQLAQENQAKADAARQGKRKTHDPNYQASHCIEVDYNFGNFGALVNTCNYKIHYSYCGYHPTKDSWLSHMACENQKFGSGGIGPLKRTTAHTKKVEGLYWLACKDPAWPLDQVFVEGKGVQGRCREPGTNY